MQEKYYRHHNGSIWEILPVGHLSMIVPKDEFLCPNGPLEIINEKRVS